MRLLPTLLLSIALLAASCSGPGGKPITEELSLDEVNSLLKKDAAYQAAILLAERFREHASTIDQAKANDLSYDRLTAFLTNLYDIEVRQRFHREGEEKWIAAYGESYERVDSLIEAWQHYLDENRPESYVKVDLAAVIPGESTYGSAKVVLEITPLKGPVDKVAGAFGLFERDKAHGFGEFSPSRHNTFECDNGLRGSVRLPAWMGYNIWGITDGDLPYNMFPDRPGLPLDKLKEKYLFDYTITTLIKDGKSIRFADIYDDVPYSIRNYWSADEKERDERSEYYYGQIAQELIDPDYVSCSDFIEAYEENHYRELDPLAAWLMFDRFR